MGVPEKGTVEDRVASLIYSFAQLEAFTAVAEHGNLVVATKLIANASLNLIDFLEDGLGYALFLREGEPCV